MAKPNNTLDYYVQQAYLQTSAGSQYKVEFSSKVKEPKFVGKRIILPILGTDCTREDLEQQRAFVNRCVAYGRHGEGFRSPIIQSKKPHEKLVELFHSSDDCRCERLEALDYVGVYDNLVRAEETALNALFKQLSTLDDAVFNDDRASRELAQISAHTLGMATWNPSSRDTLDQMGKLFEGTKTGEYLKEMFKRGLPRKFLDAETAQDSYEVSKELYDILYRDALGEGEGTGTGDVGEDGDAGNGTGRSKKDASGKSSGKGRALEYGPGVDPDDMAAIARIKASYRDYEETAKNGAPNPVIITYEGRGQGTRPPMEPLSSIEIVDFKTQTWAGSRTRGSMESLAYGSGDLSIDRASMAFANKVRALLQIKAQAYYTHGHRKGKLSTKRLFRLGMPEVGSGDWNRRIFKRRQQDKILDCAVSVMIDVSGSMHCIKHVWTYKGCVLLNEVFSRVLHVPTEINCFNTHMRTRIGRIKEFDAVISQPRLKEIFDDITGNMTSNNDATALLYAASRLVLRKEPRKILIMLSDGQPSAGGFPDTDYQLRAAAKAVEARSDMELYSIGIEYNGVKGFYKNWSEVSKGTDIEEAVLKVLSRTLLGSEVK